MKTTTQMEADFQSVTKYLEKNPDATKQQAITAIAEETNRSRNTVMTAYYRAAKKNGAVLSNTGRKRKAAVEAPPKPKKTTKSSPKRPKGGNNLDLNVIRASLRDALHTIDALEAENKKNAKIVNDLRSVLV